MPDAAPRGCWDLSDGRGLRELTGMVGTSAVVFAAVFLVSTWDEPTPDELLPWAGTVVGGLLMLASALLPQRAERARWHTFRSAALGVAGPAVMLGAMFGAGRAGGVGPCSLLLLAAIPGAWSGALALCEGQPTPWPRPQYPAVWIGAGVVLALLGTGAMSICIAPKGGKPETSAIGTLRSLATAQEQFRAQHLCDQDGDGVGEYGLLGELAGIDAIRGTGVKVARSPFIAAVLGVKDAQGIPEKSGYLYRLYLPAGGVGPALGEGQTAASAAPANADAQESRWCCYAWPKKSERSARRVFVMTQDGEIWSSDNRGTRQRYEGTSRVPSPDAALDVAGRDPRNLDAPGAAARPGAEAGDGGRWRLD